jgi:alkylation response protein AidB-like acyl-CoA dehydrogenase
MARCLEGKSIAVCDRPDRTVGQRRLAALDRLTSISQAAASGVRDERLTPVDFRTSAADAAFRAEARAWLTSHLVGEFAELGAAGGPGREHEGFEVRLAWEKELGRAGWIGLGWPRAHGGRGASLIQQVIFAEEYMRARAPARVNHMGENLLAPTLIAFGSVSQQERFLPPIVRGEELWCQGYSEPNAGSDLANVQTRAVLSDDGSEWMVTGQKVWTSLAQWADWSFVLCRTASGSTRHQGLSYLLVPMRQQGVEIRPIVQLTGTSEFNEVFFDAAHCPFENVVGSVGDGWRVAMGTLAFERGVSTLGQQIGFERELSAVFAAARASGAAANAVMRQRLADAWIGLRLMRYNALRVMSGFSSDGSAGPSAPGPEASVSKLQWATWHRSMANLGMDVVGPASLTFVDASDAARLFLFTRADTIYGGSNEIQRNVLGERVLGLPKEPS